MADSDLSIPTNALESTLTALIASADRGDALAGEQLFQRLYAELHRIARRELHRQGAAPTLGATTLLHEAFLDISARETLSFPDEARFMAYAARAMRGLIIDYARERHAQKRGGGFEFTTLDTQISDQVPGAAHLSSVGEALEELARVEPALAHVVDLKFYCGFSLVEIAAMHGVSERTVQRQWEKARIFLYRTLRNETPID